MKHQHHKNLGGMAAALFVCGATAGCNTPVEEPTDAEYELLMRSWSETDRVVSFLDAIVSKVDEDVLVDRLGEGADESSFMESVYRARDVTRGIIEEGKLYIYNSEDVPMERVSDAMAFYGERAGGDIIAWNRDLLYDPGGNLVPFLDSSIFLHEGAHAFRLHDSSIDDIPRSDMGEHLDAVVETGDFAYEITYLSAVADQILKHFKAVGDFWDNLGEDVSDEEIERRYERVMERFNSNTREDYLSVRVDKTPYELLGVTDEELTEAFEESGLWEELRDETRESLEARYQEWKQEREIVPESEMRSRGARR